MSAGRYDPAFADVEVITYRSTHAQAWVDLEGVFSDKELRALCVKPRSQNSFRPLRWDAVRAAAMDKVGVEIFGPLDATTRQMRDGHTTRPTRVRQGIPTEPVDQVQRAVRLHRRST